MINTGIFSRVGIGSDKMYARVKAKAVDNNIKTRNAGFAKLRKVKKGGRAIYASWLTKWEGEENQDYQKRQQTLRPFNTTRLINSRFTAYLYGSKVIRYPGNSSYERIHRQHFAGFDNFGIILHKEASLIGGVLLRRHWDPFQRRIIHSTLPSEYVIPEFSPFQSHGTPALQNVIIYYKFHGPTGDPKIDQYLAVKKDDEHEYLEYLDDASWVIWIDGKRAKAHLNPGTEIEGMNPYGDLSTAVTYIPNTLDMDPGEYLSDVHDTIDPNFRYHDLVSAIDAVIWGHSFPILQLIGGLLDGDFKRGPNRLAELPNKDMKFSYVTWDNVIEAAQKERDKILDEIKQQSGIPSIAWGAQKEDIGNFRSGPPIKILYAPAREKMTEKWKIWRQAEVHNEMNTFKMFNKHRPGVMKGAYKPMTIRFDESFIPRDDMVEAQIWGERLGMGAASQQDIVQYYNPELYGTELEGKISEINQTRRPAPRSDNNQKPEVKKNRRN